MRVCNILIYDFATCRVHFSSSASVEISGRGATLKVPGREVIPGRRRLSWLEETSSSGAEARRDSESFSWNDDPRLRAWNGVYFGSGGRGAARYGW